MPCLLHKKERNFCNVVFSSQAVLKDKMTTSTFKLQLKQECIPVGCVPPTSMVISTRGVSPQWGVCLWVWGGVCPGVCPGVYTASGPRGRHPQAQRQTPRVDRMTDRQV